MPEGPFEPDRLLVRGALGRRVPAAYDLTPGVTGNGDLDDETIEFFAYDSAWRVIAIYRQGLEGSGGAPSGQRPAPIAYSPWQDDAATPDAAQDDLQLAPEVDQRNEVINAFARTDLQSSWEPPVQIRHDAAGNLAFDGTFVYQYDAWNRVVQVKHV
jgi:hypothetical protein